MTGPTRTVLAGLASIVTVLGVAATSAQPDTPPGAGSLSSVWHLGRVTGDIDRIVRFYCDAIGLDFRGDRDEPITFYTVPSIVEFVGAPTGAEFRAAFMPVGGTATASNEDVYLEAFEFRHIDRRLEIPALTDIGVSTLRFLVADVDATLARLDAADVATITRDGQPVDVDPPPGYSGSARAVAVRDPDGYPVEIVQPDTVDAATEAQVLGVQMTVVVADLTETLGFYERLLGSAMSVIARQDWSASRSLDDLRAIPAVEHRRAAIVLPGSPIVLELIEFRGLDRRRYAPRFQDIGFGHIAFNTEDIERVTADMEALGATTLSQSGTWTEINASTRAVYTRDPNGFHIEVIERR